MNVVRGGECVDLISSSKMKEGQVWGSPAHGLGGGSDSSRPKHPTLRSAFLFFHAKGEKKGFW